MASIEERIKYSICQMAHISITDKYFPAYLRLEMKKHILHLREKNTGSLIEQEGMSRTFANNVKIIYNDLPKNIQETENYYHFINYTKQYFQDMALARCTSTGLL